MPASALMTIMINAARKAGRSLARDFGEVEHLQVSVKGPANFVSAADHRAESILYDELSKARQGYSFLMEERGLVEGPDKTHVWIIDPLDGTTNFLHSIPLFAISIALQRDGELVAGLIYNPASGDFYTAERGKGAFLNDNRRLRVAGRRTSQTPWSSPASRIAASLGTSSIWPSFPRSCAIAPASAAPAPRPWTSPGSRRGASTAIGSATSSPGTWRPASCCFARRAASSPMRTGARTCSRPALSSAATRRFTAS